jgi:hypothetical protein
MGTAPSMARQGGMERHFNETATKKGDRLKPDAFL